MRTPTRVKTVRSITVQLVPKVAKDLARTRKRARLSDADIVNRAISLYDFIDGQLTSGAQLLLRRPGSAEQEVQLRLPGRGRVARPASGLASVARPEENNRGSVSFCRWVRRIRMRSYPYGVHEAAVCDEIVLSATDRLDPRIPVPASRGRADYLAILIS